MISMMVPLSLPFRRHSLGPTSTSGGGPGSGEPSSSHVAVPTPAAADSDGDWELVDPPGSPSPSIPAAAAADHVNPVATPAPKATAKAKAKARVANQGPLVKWIELDRGYAPVIIPRRAHFVVTFRKIKEAFVQRKVGTRAVWSKFVGGWKEGHWPLEWFQSLSCNTSHQLSYTIAARLQHNIINQIII